jgi:hypothetical protein
LHGFWRTLPNFNPYTVTSDPGQGLADEALGVLMGGQEHRDLSLHSLPTMGSTPDLDVDGVIGSSGSTPLTSGANSVPVKYEAFSKTPSRSGTPKSRLTLKRSLQDAFAEGTAKESQILERLGTQKHERAIGELELKRRKLENKAMEKQHQREREREQHEFRMMQMRMMITQNQQAMPRLMQPQDPSLGDLGFMPGTTLPSESSPLTSFAL